MISIASLPCNSHDSDGSFFYAYSFSSEESSTGEQPTRARVHVEVVPDVAADAENKVAGKSCRSVLLSCSEAFWMTEFVWNHLSNLICLCLHLFMFHCPSLCSSNND